MLKHDDNIEKVKVIVKDTIAPKLEIKDKYTIEYNSKLGQKELKATDLSKTTVTLDDSKVNYKKAGTYKATVIAKDESNNETKKEIEIVVKEEKKEQTEKKSNSANSSSSAKGKSSSSSSSSSKKSNSSSSSSLNPSDSQDLKSTVDENSYSEIMGGNGSAWGGKFEMPDGYYD